MPLRGFLATSWNSCLHTKLHPIGFFAESSVNFTLGLSMFRVVTTIIMLAQVLTCPYMGCEDCHAAQGRPVESVANSCCTNCPDDSDGDSGPRNCPSGCESCGCFCAGAVQPDNVECPGLTFGGLRVLLDVSAIGSDPVSEAALCVDCLARRECPHFPPLASPASMRAMTQTFLV